MSSHQEVGIETARPQLGDLANQAHYGGTISYLTRNGRRVAAIVPVGSQASALPASIIDAAVQAAWPGLPPGVSAEEARRRTIAALNAAQPHLADLMDRAEREGAAAQLGTTMRDRLATVVNAELPEPAPGLVNRLADLIVEARIRAKQDAPYRATEK
ncbi:hypothetical protein [Streptomyces sp. WAC08241]|uniref:hypothetical protein n=1 Tax=Streptomyces sp. WAC08241 TaxID=2487421 RepID=UPI000F7AFE0F|nr:hypothetical protein [Streptomyces sp. WAC08241]RSS43844.1 hypothetical protein EF906_08845 [Streptomyces sp. WAC08241]